MTVVIGIDPSLTVSGCARLDLARGADGDLQPVRWETWRAKAPAPDVESVETMRRRIRAMLREVLALVPDFFDLAVIEGRSQSKFSALADERAGLRWFLIDQLLPRGPVAVVSPSTRALLATGNGKSAKPAVLAAMRAEFPAAQIADHNVADAVALAAAGAHALGMPWGLTGKQTKAHARVAWPLTTAA